MGSSVQVQHMFLTKHILGELFEWQAQWTYDMVLKLERKKSYVCVKSLLNR